MTDTAVPPPLSIQRDPWAEDHAAYLALRRFSCLDGLRFLCISAVIWHHSPLATQFPDIALAGRGFLGVDFFFVLSGFLITTLLLREEVRDGRFSLKAFYWRRLLRIVPVYFTVVAAIGAYQIFVQGEREFLAIWPYYFLFLSNFLKEHIPLLDPTWSLSVEEQYYLIWPVLLSLLPRKWIMPALIVLISANVAGVMGAFEPFGIRAVETAHLIFKLPNATYAPILLGSLLAFLLHRPDGFRWLHRALSGRFAPPASFIVLVLVVAFGPPDLRGLPNLAIHLSMAACLASLVIRDRNLLTPVLSFAPIARIGQISYGIYLYHLIGLHITERVLDKLDLSSSWLVLVAYYAVSVAISEISFRTLESYFMRMRGYVR